jgi:UDP-N-acetylglucosamine diphosphorylase/glucosamine-1-phosphate N-acetyltransferase
MRNLILFDSNVREQLLPLTLTRPVCDIRVGIMTITQKWEKWLEGKASFITQSYLSEKFPIQIEDDNYVINGSIMPTKELVDQILELEYSEALVQEGELIATRLNKQQFADLMEDNEIDELEGIELNIELFAINHLWDIFTKNGDAIKSDFEIITKGRKSQPISATNRINNEAQIFLEEGAEVEHAILNANTGPIYIGKNAHVLEGAMIRGGFALCEGAEVKMGAKIYGPTTVGVYSKVGGEITNSVVFGYSNKGHDGYMGNSILGEWCNLGADTNTSNLKNNYDQVKLWNYPKKGFVKTGQQFIGLIMGDHSKCGINTMFNTGTVVGVSANIYGAGYPRNFIPSFAWGGPGGFITYTLPKVFETNQRVMSRRGILFDDIEKKIIDHIFHMNAEYRVWEKDQKELNS